LNFKKNLRDFQDKVRDSGWWIKWIPWQEQGRSEYIYNIPLTLFAGFGGAALFLGSVIYLVFFKQDQWPILAIGLAGLIMIFLGRAFTPPSISRAGGYNLQRDALTGKFRNATTRARECKNCLGMQVAL